MDTAPKAPHRYSDDEIAAVYRAIAERRDIRHFIPGKLPEGLLERLVDAACHGPSVGCMQPWRFLPPPKTGKPCGASSKPSARPRRKRRPPEPPSF